MLMDQSAALKLFFGLSFSVSLKIYFGIAIFILKIEY
jgi:hypothetical protein